MIKVELKSSDDLNAVVAASFTQPMVLFKHSTRCPVSAMALSRVLRHPGNRQIFLINVVERRNLSNRVAAKFGVLHHSPQVLIIHNGQCIYNTSHMNIDPATLEKEIAGTKKNNG